MLFSNEESVVDDIRLENSLGKSDHVCIFFVLPVWNGLCETNIQIEKRQLAIDERKIKKY